MQTHSWLTGYKEAHPVNPFDRIDVLFLINFIAMPDYLDRKLRVIPIISTSIQGAKTFILSANVAHPSDFNTHYEAEKWIKQNGDTDTDYIVVEVLKKNNS